MNSDRMMSLFDADEYKTVAHEIMFYVKTCNGHGCRLPLDMAPSLFAAYYIPLRPSP